MLPVAWNAHDRRRTPTVPPPTSCLQIEVAEVLHAHSHTSRLLCEQQQTAALGRQPDRRATLRQNGTGGGRVFAGWIWRGLALLASSEPTAHRGGPCEEEMGLSQRRPVGGMRLWGATYDGPPPILPSTRRGLNG